MFLDGSLASTFDAVFGSFYRPGTLHRVSFTDDGGGGLTQDDTGIPIKVQIDAASMSMKAEQGYASSDVRVVILTNGVIDALENGRLSDDDEFTATDTGDRYKLAGPVLDATRSFWTARGRLIR